MTMKPKAPKFQSLRGDRVASRDSVPFASTDDGFGDQAFPGSAKAEERNYTIDQVAKEVRKRQFSQNQLRMAERLAERHGLKFRSGIEAIVALRNAGIDPFPSRNTAPRPGNKTQRHPGENLSNSRSSHPRKTPKKPVTRLPQKAINKNKSLRTREYVDAAGLKEIESVRKGIVARRRRKLLFLAGRLSALVLLPTALCFAYLTFVATPKFATETEFVVQRAELQSVQTGIAGTQSLAITQDSIMVQDFLTSRAALNRLDEDAGYQEHFSADDVDLLQRIKADAAREEVYRHYTRNLQVSFDPSEGVVRMSVAALSPEKSEEFANALIGYAEEQVDKLTERKRGDQMRDARQNFDVAKKEMILAQDKVLELQEKLGVLDPSSETATVMEQVGNFEFQITEKKLQLSQLRQNTRPNQARVAALESDIRLLEGLVSELRLQLTEQGSSGASLAYVNAQLRMAETNLETRTLIMKEALQSMEAARVEAARQVRFLSVSVPPISPDQPTHPLILRDTMVVLITLSGIYLLLSMTIAILREQASA